MSETKVAVCIALTTAFLLTAVEGTSRVVEFLIPTPAEEDPWELSRLRQFTLSPKEAGSVRVLNFGESTSIWRGGFFRQAERLIELADSGLKVNFTNFAKAGQSSTQVAATVSAGIDNQTDAIVVMTGHNEFLSLSTDVDEASARHLAILEGSLASTAFMRLVRRFSLHARHSAAMAGAEFQESSLFRTEETVIKARLKRYFDNLELIVALAQRRKVPLFLLTNPSNILDWPPASEKTARLRMLREYVAPNAYDRTIAAIKAALSEKRYDMARSQIDALLERDASDALALYWRGRLRLQTGDRRGGTTDLLSAKDRDPFPYRAMEIQNEYIRKVARRAGVFLVDVDAELRSRAPEGLLGFDQIGDNCHPSLRTHGAMAKTLVTAFHQAGLLPITGAAISGFADNFFVEGGAEPTDTFVRPDAAAHFIGLGRGAVVPPHVHWERARTMFERGLAIEPDNWQLLANLGALSVVEGHQEDGVAHLRKALQYNPDLPRVRPAVVPLLNAARGALTKSGVAIW